MLFFASMLPSFSIAQPRRQARYICWTALLLWVTAPACRHSCAAAATTANNILVVGSMNVDTFLPVERLPVEGENLTLLPHTTPLLDFPGGKGCTQAVAVAKLLNTAAMTTSDCHFIGQFGHDAGAEMLYNTLHRAGVQLNHCEYHHDLPSGRGYVFITPNGQVSAIVSGGSNEAGWKRYAAAFDRYVKHPQTIVLGGQLDDTIMSCRCLLLQREVPEHVNRLITMYAKQINPDILVLQDVGGQDRPMEAAHLSYCDYLLPNESELWRLAYSFGYTMPLIIDDADDAVVQAARFLQQHGATNVLVTRGRRGCTLVPHVEGDVVHFPACSVPVVDETGAGDCFRAAFAVALLEQQPLSLAAGDGRDASTISSLDMERCLAFASAAGACSVQVSGAVPSTPTRAQVDELASTVLSSRHAARPASPWDIPRGDGQIRGGNSISNVMQGKKQLLQNVETLLGGGTDDGTANDEDFPFLIGSRLNSMKDRPELWPDSNLATPADWVQRQATIPGLTCVDFNYPQHFHDWSLDASQAKAALDEAGLVAGAVCLRYPAKFARGAMNHPDPQLRQEAIELTKQAAQAAIELGCNEVVVWSAYDGYDYPFQVDYDDKWDELVHAFRECCDAFPDVKFSVEYKPTDENTRFFIIPSTGAALLMAQQVDRPNFGLTLDVGHMLMSGENPGQSIALVGRARKLFGVQLNDGFTRLAAEDGLMFGSVHPGMALEIMYQLRRTGFAGHVYFDTFPQRTDPIKEAEYNIRKVKVLWNAAANIDRDKLKTIMTEHDAIGALEVVDDALKTL